MSRAADHKRVKRPLFIASPSIICLPGASGRALVMTTDVTHATCFKKFVDAAVQTYGRIDVMINKRFQKAISAAQALTGRCTTFAQQNDALDNVRLVDDDAIRSMNGLADLP